MRNLGIALAVGVLTVWAVGANVALAGPDAPQATRAHKTSFLLAATSATPGYEERTYNGKPLYVAKEAVFTSGDVLSAKSVGSDTGVELKVTEAAAQRLAAATQRGTGHRLAILVGSRVVAAPLLQSVLSDGRAVLGDFLAGQAVRVARLLTTEEVYEGPLLSVVSQQTTARPGDLVTVDVFISNVENLGAYQVSLATSGGTQGTLAIEEVTIAERPDQVFGSAQAVKVSDPTQFRAAGATMGSAVNVESPAYLATYTLRVSPDASGTFSVNLDCGRETLLRNSDALPIAYRPGPAATITVMATHKPARRDR